MRIPLINTTMLKSRPRSLWNVMSPNPSVLITTIVQYTPVSHECSWPSYSMIRWKRTA